MDLSEPPATDSGYPTPRDDPPSAQSRSSSSSPVEMPLTSTPVSVRKGRPMKQPFANFHHDLSIIESTGSDSISTANDSNYVLEGVKSFLAASKELKRKERANALLRDENDTLRGENESLREENCTLREESRRIEPSIEERKNPLIPRLALENIETNAKIVPSQKFKSSEEIKKELLSFIKNEDDRTLLEAKLENMLISNSTPPLKVFTATATIQVDTDKMDADAQTDKDDHVNVVNANLQIEVDQLHSEIEVIEKKKNDLETRLFDYEQLKAKFEQDEQKLRADLEKKLKTSQEKARNFEEKIGKLELRLSNKRKELDEVSAENHRLLEDKNTHEFELEELKVQADYIEKQKQEGNEKISQLTRTIGELKDDLNEAKLSKEELEKEMMRMQENHGKVIEEFQKKAIEALEKEAVALKKLENIQSENKNLLKENQYLSGAQQKLLDSEIELKNELNVASANLRNVEYQFSLMKNQLAEESRNRKNAEKTISDLEEKTQMLENDKQEKNDLFEELRKGKLEIDHLRQQIQYQWQDSDETRKLREELLELQNKERLSQEKLQESAKRETEFERKIEEALRSDAARKVELDIVKSEASEYKNKVDSMMTEAVQNERTVVELKHAVDAKQQELEYFMTQANSQYEIEISRRDHMINDLQVRLRELETYPGQSISVSRRTVEAQTDEVILSEPAPLSIVDDRVDVSAEVTMESEKPPSRLLQLEDNMLELIKAIHKIIELNRIDDASVEIHPSSTHCASDIFLNIIGLLKSLFSNDLSESSSDKVNDLWNLIVNQVKTLNSEIDAKIDKARKDYTDSRRKIEQHWENEYKKLEELLDQERVIGEKRLTIAEGFKQQYELEEQSREEVQAEMEKIHEMHRSEVSNWEETVKSLRQRLEYAEHLNQINIREKLTRNEEHEAELENFIASRKTSESELKRRITQLESQRAFDKQTLRNMESAYVTLKEKTSYLKKRNTLRQNLLKQMCTKLEYMQSGMTECSSRNIVQLREKIQRSGLMEDEIVELSPSQPPRDSKGEENRRVFGDTYQLN